MENSYRTILLARMGEIALKGLNRGKFERQLMDNMRWRLKEYGAFSIVQSQSRIWIEPKDTNPDILEDKETAEQVLNAVTQVFGLVSASLVRRFNGDMEDIKKQAVQLTDDILSEHDYKTFKVESKRGNKRFPLASPEICMDVGEVILDAHPELTVDVHNPDFTIYIEVREDLYVYSEKVEGHRGLPVGTAGKGMLLLSGGIDSPVAGYMMASRGMQLEAIYFHSYPYTSERALEKVKDLARIVSQYSGTILLHVCNFTDIQLNLYKNSPQDMLTITMRRIMFEIAEELANKQGCKCLITGESLGQVASQTIEAIQITNEVVKTMPVFRPLIGLDKEETCNISRRIGAFETSILPYEDCCTVFVAKHPKTHPQKKHIIEAEANLDIEALVQQGVEGIETYKIERTSKN